MRWVLGMQNYQEWSRESYRLSNNHLIWLMGSYKEEAVNEKGNADALRWTEEASSLSEDQIGRNTEVIIEGRTPASPFLSFISTWTNHSKNSWHLYHAYYIQTILWILYICELLILTTILRGRTFALVFFLFHVLHETQRN